MVFHFDILDMLDCSDEWDKAAEGQDQADAPSTDDGGDSFGKVGPLYTAHVGRFVVHGVDRVVIAVQVESLMKSLSEAVGM